MQREIMLDMRKGFEDVLKLFNYSDSQISFAGSFYADPDYPVNSYVSSQVHRVIFSTFQPIILALHSYSKINISRCYSSI